jgi:hypothetical protein
MWPPQRPRSELYNAVWAANSKSISFIIACLCRNWRKIHYCSACDSDAVPRDDRPGKMRCPKGCGAEIRYHLVRRLDQLLLELLGTLHACVFCQFLFSTARDGMKTWIKEARDQALWASQQDQETFIRSDVYHGSEIRRLWQSRGDSLYLTWSLWWGMLNAVDSTC